MIYIYHNNKFAFLILERTKAAIIQSLGRLKNRSLVAIALGLFLLCLNPTTMSAQGVPLPYTKVQFLDNTGVPLSGGKVYTCVSGSSCPGTPQASYTDYTLGTQNANPVILDSAGRGSIWLAAMPYKIVLEDAQNNVIWSQDGVPGATQLTTANITYTAPYTGAVTQTLTSALSVYVNVKNFGAVGNGTTDDSTAIQTAINNMPVGGKLYFPTGVYNVCSGLPLTITRSVTLIGDGWDAARATSGSVIAPCSSLASTTDVILIQPATGSDLQGMRFQDLAISPQSGTPGRYGINISGANGSSLAYFTLDHFHIGPALGNYAIAVTNLTGSSAVTGDPYIFNITNASSIVGGVYCNLCGDTLTWVNSDFTGPRDLYLNLINQSGGAANTLNFSGNSATNAGGLVLISCPNCIFTGNEFEQDYSTTNADNAMIDIRGTSGFPVDNATFLNNEINPQATPLYPIYVNYASRTNFLHNRVAQSNESPNLAVNITSNARKTYFNYNDMLPNGNPISGSFGWLSDSSIDTLVLWNDLTTGMDTHNTNVGSEWLSTTGTGGLLAISSGTRANPAGTYCWTSGAVSSTSCDTWLNRQSAGVVGLGKSASTGIDGELALGTLQAFSPSAASVPLIMQGASGQTGNYIQITTAASNPVFSVSPSGVLSSAGNAGLTVVKTAGSCVMTFTGGLLTSVTGC